MKPSGRSALRHARVSWVLLTLAAWWPGYLLSMSADEQAALLKVVNAPAMRQHVVSTAARSTVFLQNPCPDAQFTLRNQLALVAPPVVDAAGKVTAGAWHQVVDEKGCGATRVLNVLVVARAADTLDVIPLLPGSTHASPQLQKDAVRYAVEAVATVHGSQEPNCKVGYVADTEFVAYESETLPGAKGPSWREVWTLASCTHKALVPMHFIPDPTGTTITAGPNTAVRLVPLTATAPPGS